MPWHLDMYCIAWDEVPAVFELLHVFDHFNMEHGTLFRRNGF